MNDADATLQLARRRAAALPSFAEACREFLLPDEHPLLRRTFRSKHFGGALEMEVIRFLGIRGADPRLKRPWHLGIPLVFLWAAIILLLFFVIGPSLSVAPPYYKTFQNSPLEAYAELSELFADFVGMIMLGALPLNFLVGAAVVHHLRGQHVVAELSLTGIDAREFVAALWMRCMVGYRVIEVMAGLVLINYLVVLAIQPTTFQVFWNFSTVPVVYLVGSLGARRGALEALRSGFQPEEGLRFVWEFLRITAWRYLQIAFLVALLLPLLPFLVIAQLSLIAADYPLLYMLVGWRDYERLAALVSPSSLEESVEPRAWAGFRLQRQSWRRPFRLVPAA